jgi:8-oxo-dGTP pyrophosphatase MutT (NUDIX family)
MVVIDPAAAAVLLVLQKANGKWLFPGGHVERDEAPGEAAVREVAEETGVRAQIHDPYPLVLPGMTWLPSPWLTVETPAPAKPARPGRPAEPAHRHIDLVFIGTAVRGAVMGQRDEVDDVRWVDFVRLDDLDTRAEVVLVAQRALAVLWAGLQGV